MAERTIDYDPLTGVRTIFDWDSSENRFRVGYEQDTTAIVEANKLAQLDIDVQRKQAKDEWAHYASIPTIVQYKWLYEHGVDFSKKDHWPAVMRLLNSPDYRYLKRTTYFHDR